MKLWWRRNRTPGERYLERVTRDRPLTASDETLISGLLNQPRRGWRGERSIDGGLPPITPAPMSPPTIPAALVRQPPPPTVSITTTPERQARNEVTVTVTGPDPEQNARLLDAAIAEVRRQTTDSDLP